MSDLSPEPKGSSRPAAPAGESSNGGETTNPPAETSSSTGASSANRRRRRGSRGGRGRSAAARAAKENAASESSDSSESSVDEAGSSVASSPVVEIASETSSEAPLQKPRREGQRSGRPRRAPSRQPRVMDGAAKPADDPRPAEHPTPSESPEPKVGDPAPTPKADPASSSTTETDQTDRISIAPQVGTDVPIVTTSEVAVQTDDTPAKRKRRRGGRRRGGAKKPVELGLASSDEDEPIQLDERTLEKRRGRERKGRPVGRYLMCVQVRDKATQIAVLEGRSLIEHYVSRPNDDVSQIDGNIYLSKVQNVLPGMEAAFVDIGTPKNAVLYRGDLRYDADDLEGSKGAEDAPRIEDMIKSGQTITCQVTKNPIGTKGARLTQEVSLPGRFVVLMPNSSTYGISKRLDDNERKRLRKVLDEVKPAQHGIIVRTAAEGVTADELRRDVQRLLRQWDQIEKKAARAQAPALLYREPDIAVRIIREEFNKNYRGVIIDDKELFEEVRDYVASISPELADRIEYFDRSSEALPLFERYHVHEQLHKGLDRKVWLPSGGSLIIERTEALTVIDVNTGKNVGKSNLEETVFRNNLEAAEEIAHQLRLRDIGGIIVIDFIDMEQKRNRDEVLNRLRDALARDKTRTQAYPIGELGLVEMTRKRISEGLVESFSEACPQCTGRGFVIDEALLSD